MNLDHLSWPKTGWGYLPPTRDVFDIFKLIQDTWAPKRLFEIGFHAGHSTTYQLETFPDSEIHTIGLSGPSLQARHTMKRHYGDRFKFVERQSQSLTKEEGKRLYDYAFIDGNHDFEVVFGDIRTVQSWEVPVILIDNCERQDVALACDMLYNSSTDYKLYGEYTYFSQWNNNAQFNKMRLYYVQSDNIQIA